MKNRFNFLPFIAVFLFVYSCSSPKYFHDTSSFERQKELKKDRSGNILSGYDTEGKVITEPLKEQNVLIKIGTDQYVTQVLTDEEFNTQTQATKDKAW